MSRLRLPELAAAAVALLGLVLLARALEGATPVVFFGTDEEIAARERGRTLLVPAGAAIALAAAVLAVRRRFAHAIVVLAPGVVCVALAKAWPGQLYGALAFLALAPAAFVAAVAAFTPRRRPARS